MGIEFIFINGFFNDENKGSINVFKLNRLLIHKIFPFLVVRDGCEFRDSQAHYEQFRTGCPRWGVFRLFPVVGSFLFMFSNPARFWFFVWTRRWSDGGFSRYRLAQARRQVAPPPAAALFYIPYSRRTATHRLLFLLWALRG